MEFWIDLRGSKPGELHTNDINMDQDIKCFFLQKITMMIISLGN